MLSCADSARFRGTPMDQFFGFGFGWPNLCGILGVGPIFGMLTGLLVLRFTRRR